MINILSYIGVNLQSELCLWTLLGLIRTIFDATLFKVNANLKQVWQMSMPAELSMPVQRGLRTMISGIMLLQCFSVYVYLASYIVLLYPVFLEERPALVLPWLLLAAIRKLLCELTSLAVGLGICVLLGPARPACVRFLVIKIATITPAFYMWMLVFSYYSTLKVASMFKAPVGLATSNHDYGLELAVRRRRTKSLIQDEDVLRKKLVASFNYGENLSDPSPPPLKQEFNVQSTTADFEDIKAETQGPTSSLADTSIAADRVRSDVGSYEDWFGSELVVPRDTDRILEQFVIMMLRIGVYINGKGTDPTKLFGSHSMIPPNMNSLECSNLANGTETPPLVGSHRGKVASYLQNYPQIFMKKPSTELVMIPPEFSMLQESRPEESRERSQMMPTQQNPVGDPSSVAITSEETRCSTQSDSEDSFDHYSNEMENCSSCYKSGSNSTNTQKEPAISSSRTTTTSPEKGIKNGNRQNVNKQSESTQNSVDSLSTPSLLSEHQSETSTTRTQTDNEARKTNSIEKILERMKRNLPRNTSSDKKGEQNIRMNES